ncbi:Auxin-responsive protein [Quillaja saponaria]|uniref:Auxin-responsive protein n=1 Tax=Quillaja saponaria TaxID=32244 RepID=A0AAD7LZE9_QUISA|nr:Auxin-responsive protein [Quillaja saponaria]
MMNPKKLVKISKKRQIMATSKGHFVVYSSDQKRFEVPLEYLSTDVFRELLKMSEEEFGLTNSRPIKLTGDSIFLEYVILILRSQGYTTPDIHKAMLCVLLQQQVIIVCSSNSWSKAEPSKSTCL